MYGANGTGKTTTATALQWLLFDKGLDGSTKSFNPVPLKENNEEDYELIPTVEVELNKDGKPLKSEKKAIPNTLKIKVIIAKNIVVLEQRNNISMTKV